MEQLLVLPVLRTFHDLYGNRCLCNFLAIHLFQIKDSNKWLYILYSTKWTFLILLVSIILNSSGVNTACFAGEELWQQKSLEQHSTMYPIPVLNFRSFVPVLTNRHVL